MQSTGLIAESVLQIIKDDYEYGLESHIRIFISILATSERPGGIPDSVNGEIRNALNHLGRALAVQQPASGSKAEKQAADEIDNARWHMQLGSCDILNESIRIVQKDIDDITRYITHQDRHLDGAIVESIQELRKRYLLIRSKILRGGMTVRHPDIPDIIASQEGLLDGYLVLHRLLFDSVAAKPGKIPVLSYMRRAVHSLGVAVLSQAKWNWSSTDCLRAAAAALGALAAITVALSVVFGSFVAGIKDGWPILLIASVGGVPVVIMFGLKRPS